MTTQQEELMTDEEVADFLRISVKTLYNHLKNGPPQKRNTNSGDVRLIDRVHVGGKRLWRRNSVMQFINK